MKDKALLYVSLLFSLAAISYAAWVHYQAQSFADAAVRERERQFVEALAPKLQRAYETMGITNRLEHPATLEQLFGPYLDRMNGIIAGEHQ